MSARRQDGRVDSLPRLFLNTLSLQPSSTRQEDPMKGTSVDAKRKQDDDGGPTNPKAQKIKSGSICYHTVNVLGALQGTRIRGIEVGDKKGVLYRNGEGMVSMSDNNYWKDKQGKLTDALSSVQDTVFEIVEGVIWPSTDDRKDVEAVYGGREGWINQLQSFRGCTPEAAAVAVNSLNPPEGTLIGHEYRLGMMGSTPSDKTKPMEDLNGNECKLKIINLGPRWQHLDLEVGMVISPVELGKRIHAKFLEDPRRIGYLALRSYLWIQHTGNKTATHEVGDTIHQNVYELLGGKESLNCDKAYYDIAETSEDIRRYCLPESADTPFTPELAKTVFDEITAQKSPKPPVSLWPILAQKGIAHGALKSIMQKVVRFGAEMIKLPDEKMATAEDVMIATTLLCLSTKGNGYLPNLHTSLRGTTQACKRLAIIAVEDSWFYGKYDNSNVLRALTAFALATMRLHDYHINKKVARVIALRAKSLVESPQIVAWRTDNDSKAGTHKNVSVTWEHMDNTAKLMRILRSFEGDMQMLETAASMSRNGELRVRVRDNLVKRPAQMPLEHMIDQHVYQGIGHMVINMDTSKVAADNDTTKPLGPRFRTIFGMVTGYNPRLAKHELQENESPIKEVRTSQELISLRVFQDQHKRIPQKEQNLQIATASILVDPAIIAQAVGPLSVTISQKEYKSGQTDEDKALDKKDGIEDAASANWKLFVILGNISAEEVVIHVPQAHIGEQRKKPQIPATVRRLAIQKVRDYESVNFKSKMMPEYNSARYNKDKGAWEIFIKKSIKDANRNAASTSEDQNTNGAKNVLDEVVGSFGNPEGNSDKKNGDVTPPILWSWDNPIPVSVPFFVCPPKDSPERPLDDTDKGIEVAKRTIRAERISPLTLNLRDVPQDQARVDVATLDEEIRSIIDMMGVRAREQNIPEQKVHMRFLSCISASYDNIALPLPSRQGGLSENELFPAKGDWIVYRALLLLAALAPSALQSSSPSKLSFHVNDARVLRHVESLIKKSINDANRNAASTSEDQNTNDAKNVLDEVVGSFGNPEGKKPRPHQQLLIDEMLVRDERSMSTRGTFLSLDTGAGKTAIATLYALNYVAEHPNCKRIVWFTKKKIADNTMNEIMSWGIKSVRILNTTDQKSTLDGHFDELITIVNIERFSQPLPKPKKGEANEPAGRDKLTNYLVELAQDTLFVADEVHELYNTGIGTSNLLQIISVCPKYVCMTATPAASPSQIMAREWLKGTVNFPVESNHDILVASASMVAGRMDLKIKDVDEDMYVNPTPETYMDHMRALEEPGGWDKAARIAREGIFNRMVDVVINEAVEDRKTNPGGGVLVFMNNETEREKMIRAVKGHIEENNHNFSVSSRNANSNIDPTFGVVVTTMQDTAGYNMQRLGSIVKSVYASNAARRHQLRGRIKRIGQKRETVRYVTVIPGRTILELLYKKHLAVEAVNASLDALAKQFIAENPKAMDTSE